MFLQDCCSPEIIFWEKMLQGICAVSEVSDGKDGT